MSLRPTLIRLGKGTSSSRKWIARQSADPYVKKRAADPAAYRARSAFKLLEINDKGDNFLAKLDVNAVVDLGAAPGGWSQVVASKLGWTSSDTSTSAGTGVRSSLGTPTADASTPYGRQYKINTRGHLVRTKTRKRNEPEPPVEVFDPLALDEETLPEPAKGRGTIIAADLLRMRPINGVHDLVADFLAPETDEAIQDLLKANGAQYGKVDVILSDMAANASGNDTRDIECSLQICEAVLQFAQRHLRTADTIGRKKGGVVLVKHFAHPELDRFRTEKLIPNFNVVKYIKPDSSRAESREGYFLCMGWKGLAPTS